MGREKTGTLHNASIRLRGGSLVCLLFSCPEVTFVLLPPSGHSIPKPNSNTLHMWNTLIQRNGKITQTPVKNNTIKYNNNNKVKTMLALCLSAIIVQLLLRQ